LQLPITITPSVFVPQTSPSTKETSKKVSPSRGGENYGEKEGGVIIE
jgi:hypothetical protein